MLALGKNADQRPTLGARQGPAFDDFHRVAGIAFVVFIMNMAHGASMQNFAVFRVANTTGNFDAAGLVHFVAGDNTDGNFLGHGVCVPYEAVLAAGWARSV